MEAAGEAGFEQFSANWKTQSAILHQLLILGEATKRLTMEFRVGHPQIPWRKFAGLRDRVIHRYDDVSLEEVWRTVERDIPHLNAFLESAVQEDPQ